MTRSSSRWLVVALATVVVAAAPGAPGAPGSPHGQDCSGPPAGGVLRVLHGWDRQRAMAYETGDARALRALYVSGSAAGRADLRLLRRYADRGLRVTGWRMQLLELSSWDQDGRWLRVTVTDRLHGGVVLGRRQAVGLPRDNASTWLVTLRATRDGTWQVAGVAVRRRSPVGHRRHETGVERGMVEHEPFCE